MKYFFRLRSNGKEKRVIFFNFRQPPNTLHIHSFDQERTWPEAHCHVCDFRALSTMGFRRTKEEGKIYTVFLREDLPFPQSSTIVIVNRQKLQTRLDELTSNTPAASSSFSEHSSNVLHPGTRHCEVSRESMTRQVARRFAIRRAHWHSTQ